MAPNPAESRPRWRRALREPGPPDQHHVETGYNRSTLGETLALRDRFAEAEPWQTAGASPVGTRA